MIATVYQVWDRQKRRYVASFPVVGEPEGDHSQAIRAARDLSRARNEGEAVPRFQVDRGLRVGGRVI